MRVCLRLQSHRPSNFHLFFADALNAFYIDTRYDGPK